MVARHAGTKVFTTAVQSSVRLALPKMQVIWMPYAAAHNTPDSNAADNPDKKFHVEST